MDNITLEWFFQLPGLFITGGVLLILIAIIVYIIASKKEKSISSNETNYGVDTSNMESETNENVVTPIINPSMNNVTSNENVNTIGGQPVNVVGSESVAKEAISSFEPTITPIVPANKEVENNVGTSVSAENNDNTQQSLSTEPIITPIEPSVITPVVPEVKEEIKIEPALAPVEPVVENGVADIPNTVEVNVEPPKEVVVEEKKTLDDIKIVPTIENQIVSPNVAEINPAPSVGVADATKGTNEENKVSEEIKIEPSLVTPVVESNPSIVKPEIQGSTQEEKANSVMPAESVTLQAKEEEIEEI